MTQHSAGAFDNGYILFAPISNTNTYLIDKCGYKVKSWPSIYKPALSCYLLPDGTLLRTGNTNNTTFNAGGKGGVIEKIDWSGNVVWSYSLSTTAECMHHDVRSLPNGNVLAIVWEAKTNTQAISQGRNPLLVPSTVWSEKIIEIQPVGLNGGTIVWEWHLWDHLVQNFDATKPNFSTIPSNPQLVNINFNASGTNSDWIHLNSIDYNAELDQIVVSSHGFDEVWIIDHSTTTLEAASHSGGNSGKGGDLLYRWGNPSSYNTAGTQIFFGQHDAHWVKNGLPFENQIMVFNNGNGRTGGNYSTIEIINPPVMGFNYSQTLPYMPNVLSWNFNQGNPNVMYAQNISGIQQLSNGNVLYCNGPVGTFTEISSTGTAVWNYVNPVGLNSIANQGVNPSQNAVFKASFYENSYSGFAGQILNTSSTIENNNTISANCTLSTDEFEFATSFKIYPNPTQGVLHFSSNQEPITHIAVLNLQGQQLFAQSYPSLNATSIDVSSYSNGMYVIVLNQQATLKLFKN